MESSTKKIASVLGLIIALGAIGYTAYYYLAGGGSAAGKKAQLDKLKALNKQALDDAKAAATVKKQINTTTSANPNDPTLAGLQAQLKQLLAQSASSTKAAQQAGGSTNADGSKATNGTTNKGVPMTVVDEAGDYIEEEDPTTLYNSSGDVIGDLNAETGFFENENGTPIASCDGTPLAKTDSNGNYQEADGQWYDNAGDPITLNGDGTTYIDSTDAVDVYNMNGDVVGELNNDGTYTDSNGMCIVLDSGRIIGKTAEINSYNSDGSVDYIDGSTLSGDGMTLEYPDGSLVSTGGKKVEWYDGSTGDIHYAS